MVLTFDDGPWPQRTMAVRQRARRALHQGDLLPDRQARHLRARHPQAGRRGAAIRSAATPGATRTSPSKPIEEGKDEIEKGISAVAWAVGGPTAPFFRFPALRHPPELVTYLGERNIAIFSTDMDSFDFKMRRPEQVRQAVMAKLKKYGKGIVLMHDFQQATAAAAADLLNDLKAGGYKIVHMRAQGADHDDRVL